MANVKKTIEIIFAGTDKVTNVIGVIENSAQSFGDGLQDLGAPFAEATKTVLALDAAIIGLGVAGLKASADLEGETKKMAASLGLPTEEAERFKDIAKEVYTDSIGVELVESFEAVTLAQKKFGDNAEIDIGKVSKQAFELQKTFGVDYKESFAAVNTLMKNFGITSTEAFDFVVAGYRKGLDGSGDFLESINEYGVQFANGQATAGQFFSVLETGFQEGLLGTDKAADLFKEFRVRIQGDSQTVKDALASIGIDNAELQANLNSGKTTVIEAFDLIVQKINETDDQGKAFRAGVELLGTPFEDLGQEAVKNLDITKTKIEDLSGAIEKLDTKTISDSFSTLYKTITTEIADNKTWEAAKSKLSDIFVDMTESFKTAFKDIDLSDLEGKVANIWDSVADIFKDADLDLTTVEGMENAINLVIESVESLADITSGLVEIFSPMVKAAFDLAEGFNDLDSDTKELIGNVLALGTTLATAGAAISAGGSFIGGIKDLTSLLASGGALRTGISGVSTALTGGASSLLASLSSVAGPAGLLALSAGIGAVVGSLTRMIPGVDEAAEFFAEWSDEIFNWTGTKGIGAAADSTDELSLSLYRAQKALQASTGEIETATASTEDFNEMLKLVQETPTEVSVNFEANADPEALAIAQQEIKEAVPTDEIILFQADLDEQSVKTVSNKIDETVDPLKRLEIEAELQTAMIEAQAETIQNAVEWKAKLDIAEVEANARKVEAIAESVGDTAESAGDALASIFGNFSADSHLSWDMKELIDDQVEIQREALKIQQDLAQAEVDYLNEKTKQISSGTSLIEIRADGLEPALEMIWQEVIKHSQVRANEEGLDLLL